MEKFCGTCKGSWFVPAFITPHQIIEKKCASCCLHDKGWWQLVNHYKGENGRWACKAGCGTVKPYPIQISPAILDAPYIRTYG